ncbi:benenodin family lasso peptide (plasmid) [Sphingomonas paeninsulae]|uniref:Benenodin family lasso peptide n=1 Tax=Sphingomonas paeninsulae TaxID=2319844 RepID=A0A494TDU4_SPHPE|nr:benenodin family lasso peptide [Sphingomonas paeninsulae]AYJ85442.1 benenodin family lasso peptide [Sphingomonas paeninsulae]
MERIEDVIELGTATIETKGPLGQGVDENKRIPVAGLSED